MYSTKLDYVCRIVALLLYTSYPKMQGWKISWYFQKYWKYCKKIRVFLYFRYISSIYTYIAKI